MELNREIKECLKLFDGMWAKGHLKLFKERFSIKGDLSVMLLPGPFLKLRLFVQNTVEACSLPRGRAMGPLWSLEIKTH